MVLGLVYIYAIYKEHAIHNYLVLVYIYVCRKEYVSRALGT